MKKMIALLMALSLVCFSVPVFAEEQAEAPRILVAYLSRAGENYNVGETRKGSASAAYAGYIEKGNTAIMAALIAELTGGALFEITTVTPYQRQIRAGNGGAAWKWCRCGNDLVRLIGKKLP